MIEFRNGQMVERGVVADSEVVFGQLRTEIDWLKAHMQAKIIIVETERILEKKATIVWYKPEKETLQNEVN